MQFTPIFLVLLCSLVGNAFGQSTKIIGSIYGEEEETIAGATVMLVWSSGFHFEILRHH